MHWSNFNCFRIFTIICFFYFDILVSSSSIINKFI